MTTKFLEKYFSAAKTGRMRKEIHNFSQGEGETVFESWERFKELLRRCPYNGMEQWMQLHYFWDGLKPSSRILLNSVVVGPLMKKTSDEIVTLLNELSEDAEQWSTDQGDRRRPARVHQVKSSVAMQAQIAAMAKDIKQLTVAQVQNQPQVGCEICRIGHPTHECQTFTAEEEVKALGNFNKDISGVLRSSSNGSLNSWKQQNPRAPVQRPPGFKKQQRQPYQPPQPNKSSLEDLMKAFINKSNEQLETQGTAIREQGIAIRNLEKQMEPIAKPRVEKVINSTKIVEEQKIGESLAKEDISSKEVDKQKSSSAVEERKHMPVLPFPQKMKWGKLDKFFGKFLKMLKQMYVNIPFTEGSWQLHYTLLIGERNFDKALCNSSTSINFMPLSVFKKLEGELGVIKSVMVSLQLADQTTIIPKGIIEEILVRVDKFVFPVDFIVVDMEVNKEVTLILRRLFLCTGEHEHMLVELLGKHKKAISWSIDNIQGIIPAICIHKILLEEGSKLVVQPQHKLNKNLDEVVQKEILKLLDAAIIFPFSDS
uniref:Retrotransposon gag domain-containing protein n=1 Tax=Nicotiana tabacum TaxID=4097 RepID=A0A1S4D173_TOBAC|nr:PREDICTED: uncharacterized protein LOC107824879 [Nicotiana tabacum]